MQNTPNCQDRNRTQPVDLCIYAGAKAQEQQRYRQKVEYADTHDFNVENPNREKTKEVHKPQEQNHYEERKYNKMFRGDDLETFFV